MKRQTFGMPSISCGHCTTAIENKLHEMAGVVSTGNDISGKTVTVEWDNPATPDKILLLLKKVIYPASG